MMPTLIDTSLWIDFTRARSPKSLKRLIAPYVLDPEAHIAEPIIFEVLRSATPAEFKAVTQQFAVMPTLETPPALWTDAAELGQACRRKGVTVNAFDLLVATIALHHGAEVITFDSDFAGIATASELRVKSLQRPSS